MEISFADFMEEEGKNYELTDMSKNKVENTAHFRRQKDTDQKPDTFLSPEQLQMGTALPRNYEPSPRKEERSPANWREPKGPDKGTWGAEPVSWRVDDGSSLSYDAGHKGLSPRSDPPKGHFQHDKVSGGFSKGFGKFDGGKSQPYADYKGTDYKGTGRGQVEV